VPGEDEALIDLQLARQAGEGDREAFGRLVVRHQASVFRLARLLARSPEQAEDILQQAFLSAWAGVRRFRGESSVRTWLLTITRNAALTQRSRAAREPVDPTPLETIADLGLRAGWGGPTPEEVAIQQEQHDHLTAAFGRLSDSDREIITLRDLEGLSGEETAVLLGLSLPAMKSRLHRARMTLAAAVREESAHATRRA